MGIGRPFALAAAALALTLAPAAVAVAQAARAHTVWYSILAPDGTHIGHASAETTEGPTGTTIVQTQEILLAGEGGDRTRVVERSVIVEDRNGRLVSATSQSRSGRRQSKSEARLVDGVVSVSEETPAGRHSRTLTVPGHVRFDGGEALLKTWNPADGQMVEFEQFNVGAMGVERVVIEAAPPLPSDPAGLVPVLKRRYSHGSLVGIARLLLDSDGKVAAVVQPMFGSSVTIRTVDRQTALARQRPFRVLGEVMTKSPVRISDAAAAGHIRYRFTFRDGMSFDIPHTGEQMAAKDGDGATVDICAVCGSALATDEATLADALKPTLWMQSDHPRLRALAKRTIRPGLSQAQTMERLTEEARLQLRAIDFTGHYSALETLSRQSGDCTEAAVLLAALGRAAGIPTKVVNGLVYSRERYHGVGNVFMPHSWVLAYVDGKWRSYDSALDRFDSTHIALTIGDGDNRSIVAAGQLASLLQWQAMAEVRTRPAN